jgi:hypothetical protein
MNYIVMYNGKPIEIFNTLMEAVQFKRYCKLEFSILTTIEEVLG